MMNRFLPLLALSALSVSSAVAEGPALSERDRDAVGRLTEKALADDTAWTVLESLTTEVGPRLGGSEAEARAREWGAAKMKELGFKNVRIETFSMPAWSRIAESASIVTPFPQALHVTAIGNSISTPEGGVTGEVVRFGTLTALQQAPLKGLEGKIVFVDEQMTRTQDGSGYGVAVAKRSEAAYEAAKRGALAAVIRSVGTDSHRNPHTGMMRVKEGEAAAPAAALSNPDADQLSRAISLAKKPVVMTLNLQTARTESALGGNVVGEIPGRTDEMIVIGGHLDSWDLGTGAVDDGAGIAITLAAAKLIDEMKGKPGRTIRVVMWGAEEVGLFGAKDYAERHKGELSSHVLAAESDFGAGRIWSMQTRFGEKSLPNAALFAEALRPLGVGPGDNEASGGADVSPLRAAGVPVIDLNQDGTDYFDLHHTPDDTLDKVSPDDLRQNVAAWAVMLYLSTEIKGGFRE